MILEHLRNRLTAMGTSMDDDDLIAHIASNLPEEYSELVTSLEADLESLNIRRLKERIRAYYMRKISSKSKIEKEEEYSVALMHTFKGR